MNKTRIGKDISFVWKNIKINDQPIASKENLTLEIHKVNGRNLCCTKLLFDVIDGKVVATWLGVNQQELGEYTLTLWFNKGKVGESALDAVSVVELVANTSLEENSLGSELEIETITISGDNLTFAVIKGADGKDATIVDSRFDDEGNTIITWSDGKETVIKRGKKGDDGGMLFPAFNYDVNTGIFTISGQGADRFSFDYANGMLYIRIN